MGVNLSVVAQLRDTPSLMDMAGHLRRLADEIEGKKLPAEYVHVLVGDPESLAPRWFGYGAVQDRHSIAGMFLHVAQLALVDR